MKKSKHLLHLISAALCACLLLTFSVAFLTNTAVGGSDLLAPTAFDGSALSGKSVIERFNRAVLQNKASQESIKEAEYRLLGVVQSDNVIAGKNDFLFEITDKKTGYNYLDDYQGKLHFTNEEKRLILKELRRRTSHYSARGADYLLIIVPNAQTVYSENMPNYIGDIAARTRLDDLDAYLRGHRFNNYLNLTDALMAAKSDGALYHNTENALSSLGLYHLYCAVSEQISPDLRGTDIISRDTLTFHTYDTQGRRLAKEAGLSEVIKNHTVTLTNDRLDDYATMLVSGYISKTERLPEDGTALAPDAPSLLLQFSDAGSRLLAEPYFSCTFDYVTYQSNLFNSDYFYGIAAPDLVIQVVYEYELSSFLHN